MLNPQGPSRDELLTTFRKFYFDTALSSGKYAMACLLEFADPERVLFGSDFPYAPAPVAGRFTDILDGESGLSEAQKRAIYAENAHKIFRRFNRFADPPPPNLPGIKGHVLDSTCPFWMSAGSDGG